MEISEEPERGQEMAIVLHEVSTKSPHCSHYYRCSVWVQGRPEYKVM